MSSSKWIKADTKAKILDLNAAGLPARIIADRAKTSPSVVYRTIAKYAGDCRAREVKGQQTAGMLDELVRLAIGVKNDLTIIGDVPGADGEKEAANGAA